ncbi:hypothetical protein PNC201_21675 (plasmid) [Pseudoalteromonas sp. NC201]|nr:hypothetical protein PNC201_21675 [Pseudoalteromonas sp. NC201]
MRKRTMKAAQKKPIKIALSRSLCKLISGAGLVTGSGPKNQQAESTPPEEKSQG